METLVREAAESVGQTLSASESSEASVCSSLAPDAQARLREVLQDARKLMRHGKRCSLLHDDLNRAIFLRRAEPLYGQPAHAGHWARPARDLSIAVPSDGDANLSAEASGSFLPNPPTSANLIAHWLCVDGTMPNIPENPSPDEQDKAAAYATSAATAAAEDDHDGVPSAEPKPMTRPARGVHDSQPKDEQARDSSGRNVLRLPVAHALPQEVQLFGEKLAEATMCCGAGSRALHASLDAIRRERAVTQLAPYLVSFFAEEMTHSGERAANAISASRALLCNQHVNLAPYLQELIPPILTCAVAKKLSGTAATTHLEIRDSSAVALALIIQRYASSHPSLRPRASRPLCRILTDSEKPPQAVYGAVQCLRALGQRTVRSVLLPNALDTYRNLQRWLSEPKMQEESLRALGVLHQAVGTELHTRLLQEHLPESALEGDDTGPILEQFLGEVGDAMEAFVPSSLAVLTFV